MIVSKIIRCFILTFIFCTSVLYAQNIEFKKVNFKNDKSGLKDAKENITIADEIRINAIKRMLSMQDADLEFNKAVFYYKKAQSFNANNAQLNYHLGICLLFTNSKEEAFAYLKRAKILYKELPFDFWFYYAMCLQLEGKYAQAKEKFEFFRDNSKKKEFERYDVLCKKYIEECVLSNNIMNEENRVWVDNIPINTQYDEWAPCLSTDGELLIFSSNRPNNNQADEIDFYDYEIYHVNRRKRKFTSVLPLKDLNTKSDDVSGGLSYDGQRMLIFKSEDGTTDVYESKLNGRSWGQAKRKMGAKLKGGNTEHNETFASYDPPDVKVYYITDGGYSGNKNIYFSGVMDREKNIWGGGQSAGPKVNTKFQEGSVYIHPDARTMYFSSKGHNTLGGYDIFVSYIDDLGQWGTPINLGYPINTPYDDLFYSPNASGKLAYIASNRKGGKGGMDIYKVVYWGTDKPMSTDFEDQLMASIASPVSDNVIAEPITISDKSLTVFKGTIIDAVTKKPVSSDIVITLNSTGNKFTSCQSNSATGKFLLSLPSGENYGISVAADGYLFHSENFDLPAKDDFNLVDKEIELNKIKVGSNITLRNVFFDTGKWLVKTESYPELKRVVKLLNSIPSLKIEISGHTDNIGNDDFNKNLSQKRADAVLSYIVNKGISRDRLSSKGLGESMPIESNETEEGRAKNRRTDFKIIEN